MKKFIENLAFLGLSRGKRPANASSKDLKLIKQNSPHALLHLNYKNINTIQIDNIYVKLTDQGCDF